MGIIDRSPLLDFPGFDIIKDIPVDWMHGTCLGVVRMTFELTFDMGKNRKRKVPYKRVPVGNLNSQIIGIKWPTEFSRRSRVMDYSNWKAEEWRNLILFLHPIVVQVIPDDGHRQERELWLYLAYYVRAYVLPEEEFQHHSDHELRDVKMRWYELHYRLFGMENCPYNVHVFTHLKYVREKGDPLTETSAYPFEGFFATMRRSFTPGSMSSSKQIFENVLLMLQKQHTCLRNIQYNAKVSVKTQNNLVYMFKNGHYTFYEIQTEDQGRVYCHKVVTRPNVENTVGLDFSKVGIYRKFGTYKSETITLYKDKICGKAVHVDKFIISCPCNILRE